MTLLDVVLWIVFGAIAGWVASIIVKTNQQMGMVSNIIVGIVGAFIGGFIIRATTGNQVGGFNLASLLVAILGAVILLVIVRALTGFRAHHHA